MPRDAQSQLRPSLSANARRNKGKSASGRAQVRSKVPPALAGLDIPRQMRYHMGLAGRGDQRFFFDGFKVVRDDSAFSIQHHTSTLYITLIRGEDSHCPVAGKGILKILVNDFIISLQRLKRSTLRTASSACRWRALCDRNTAEAEQKHRSA